jgi:outer membrane protein assembly factor BamE (lipoprotein component of BamABCDE complex)
MNTGRDFNVIDASKIQRGVSTREDVRKVLGKPFSTSINNGKESWSYMYADSGVKFIPLPGIPYSTGHQKTKIVNITFDGDVVETCDVRENEVGG